ncbi:LPXTG cell wall anchor domain-containing protein [Enterococcus diestrammenae]|uniref:LPXTG cell wall anchor domain-containing protein n=1 Tax=Enterococcus diestrammenae TaxID=1155073 RepID=UPI0022E00D07|nr:LPXTG cell wall anchor domain-containing protein [Enterococcus diestrammenae]
MTKLKKKLALLAAVSLLSLPAVSFAAEDAESHTGIVDLELVESSSADSTETTDTTEPTETTESSETTETSESSESSSSSESDSSSDSSSSSEISSESSETERSRDRLPVTGGGTTGGTTSGGSKLPSTGDTVNFVATFMGTILLGVSGILLLKRKKGGDA